MKLLLSILFLSGFALFAKGQNLIINPGMDDVSFCPWSADDVEALPTWYSPSGGSPNVYNTCVPFSPGAVPNLGFSYQNPHNGSGYMGGAWFPYGKEYITGKLSTQLNAGKKYCLSFFLNLSDTQAYVLDRIGVYFSNDSIFYNTFFTLPVTPQLETPAGQFFADTANWMPVSFEYIAQGGERYLTFGNFHNDTTTNVYKLDSTASYSYAYYFIDDVSLICCDADSCILNLPAVIPNVFTPDNDGVNDVFKIENLAPNSSLTIYNRWGNTVYQSSNYQNNWDGGNSPAGVYYYILSPPGGKQAKGTVTLLKN